MSTNKRDIIIDSPHFKYMLIRDFLLTNILAGDTDEILYWSGKELARQFPLTDQEDIEHSFSHCGFGDLTLLEADKNQQIYQLSGDLITTRLLFEGASFQLEAGFLAEQTQRIKGLPCEASVEINEKKEILLTVVIE